MPSKNKENTPVDIVKGQFLSMDSNYVRIGFTDKKCSLVFCAGKKTEDNGSGENYIVDSSVSINLPAEAICGLSSVLSEAFESYKNKLEQEKSE